jgi:SIR2-like domain
MCPDSDKRKSVLSQNDRTRMLAEARRGSLIPFIGAGFSSQAVTENKPAKENHSSPTQHVFPTWRILAEDMLALAQEEGYVDEKEAEEMRRCVYTEEFPWVAEKLRFRLPVKRYRETLIEKLNPPSIAPTNIHEALFKLNAPIILTTNYDLLLEDAYARKEDKAANVYTYRDTDLALQTIEENRLMIINQGNNQGNKRYDVRPIVFKIYGSISSSVDMILTERDFNKKIIQQVDLPDLLSKIFITNTVLLLGFSTFDVELTMLLDNLRAALRYDATPDYMFLSKEAVLKDIRESAPGKPIVNAKKSIQAEIDKFKRYKINIVLFERDEDVFKLLEEMSGEVGKQNGK